MDRDYLRTGPCFERSPALPAITPSIEDKTLDKEESSASPWACDI